MGRLNSKQLEYARCLCLGRDGYNCRICGKSLLELNSISNIDHIDGNSDNNPLDGSNWQLSCHSCNVQKWHRQKYETILDTGNPEESITLRISSKMEYRWNRWLYAQLNKKNRVSLSYAINTGALEIDGNPVTTKRYLQKHIEAEHDKALFKKVFVNFDTFVTLTDQARDNNSKFV